MKFHNTTTTSFYLVLVEEHTKLLNTDTQICLVKLVGDVPAERTELSPLLDCGVEETQTEQQLLERSRLLTRVEELRITDRISQIGSDQVHFETLGWFVCHFHTVL